MERVSLAEGTKWRKTTALCLEPVASFLMYKIPQLMCYDLYFTDRTCLTPHIRFFPYIDRFSDNGCVSYRSVRFSHNLPGVRTDITG